MFAGVYGAVSLVQEYPIQIELQVSLYTRQAATLRAGWIRSILEPCQG
jgi:hypothetical protein